MKAWGAFAGPLRGGVLHRFLGREAWALADQAVVSATSFLTNILLARFMGLREFGIFALAWMSVLFVNSLQNALVIAPMTSVGPKQNPKERPSYFGAVVFQELILLCFYFALVYTGLFFFSGLLKHPELHRLAMPLAVSAFAYQAQDFVRRYFFVTAQSRFALADDAVTGAHNDFTAWNIRLSSGAAKVFDWEYAAWQQLPLFDPFHFNLMPMALRSESVRRMEATMDRTIDACGRVFGRERCYRPREQALAYLLNLCTLYMWADGGMNNSHPALVSYAGLMDRICDSST